MRMIAEIPVDPARGRVYEHGWQSWSPSTTYPVTATSHRPSQPALQTMCWRPARPGPGRGFQGEGLLAVDPGTDAPVRVFGVGADGDEVPSIRASLSDDGRRLLVTADGEAGDQVDDTAFTGPLDEALAAWADAFARQAGVGPLRAAPTAWCSWYSYGADVTAADVVENLEAIARLDLPVDVIQIDDGWQAEIGDWIEPSDRFGSISELAKRIRHQGRRAGVWIAPFLVGARSELARDHPDWLVAGADAGHNWDQQLFALDVTHPDAAAYLVEVLSARREQGFDYVKVDFAYAGALAGRRYVDLAPLTAYRYGLWLLRDAVGPDAFLVGSGAPILPSVGRFDALRVSPDIDVRTEPVAGDMSRPSLRAAVLSTIGRAWQHGRFWVNDPDCILARPDVVHRQAWAEIVQRYGGLRATGDRIVDLDDWGIETTRRLLGSVPPPVPFRSRN